MVVLSYRLLLIELYEDNSIEMCCYRVSIIELYEVNSIGPTSYRVSLIELYEVNSRNPEGRDKSGWQRTCGSPDHGLRVPPHVFV